MGYDLGNPITLQQPQTKKGVAREYNTIRGHRYSYTVMAQSLLIGTIEYMLSCADVASIIRKTLGDGGA